ncbi:NAD-dependent succinate-semialdehyde dehydrogenase [Pseudomonas putida]|jgi:succinate-semialdehyde dehydrogenase/glutarate-semialdehyde dehydrogenase|uniref:NAD-dependent succinate-semialdehyde dehydrogenase n=1 Tax=Pseudomonas putida TaxID=303 RepID=UPI000981AB0B|nr:NAD-dependent succinate-semialdehyde dehydrogenase [Pseudomonas putida]MBH2033613.1 NAD-dependent succinate-semialdehyde dehydrogenase [Pseudomonadales bacterium]OMQ41101.1 succinate-semialdehyde dehydrogenase (NADP(+)) [Pseudomonas putida]
MRLADPELLREFCYIDGQWVAADNAQTIDVTNPATGEVIGRVPRMGDSETRRAVDAAQAALPAWRALTAKERASRLQAWFREIMNHQQDLAQIMTAEQGKPLAEARGEIAFAAAYVEWYAEEGKRIYGDVIPSPHADRRLIVTKEPIGVCAAITPWNFPAAMITRKAAPALAAGCTLVLKPASQTPFSALALCVLAERAGIPRGVLSVITGDSAAIGGELTSSPIVRKLSFTGSTPIGIKLLEQCAATVKKVTMELGGNAPFIVFDDADLDAAVEGALIAKFRNAGQTCVCANRFFIQDGIYDRFVEKFAARIKSLVVGEGTQAGVEVGPMIDAKALAGVEALVVAAREAGARVVAGGKPHALGGAFYEPTLLADVTADMRVAQEEIFGPVAPLFRFSSENEVVALANATEFGLACYLYARDLGRVWRVSEALEYGMVGVNVGVLATEVAPFGGVKSSGLGREGSRYGIEDYVEIKYLCLGLG